MIKLLSNFFFALPQIIDLFKAISEMYEGYENQKEIKAQLKKDIPKITKAIKEKDAEALNNILNS